MPGRWTHSFEEDHDGVTVYRRDDYAFPPARGRRGVQFRPDGTLLRYTLGRADAPEERPAGRWSTDGRITNGRIVSATPDRLEIRWED
ncbi:hypothetical protein ACI2LF_20475 [Kribbella sp. NPDC020789]